MKGQQVSHYRLTEKLGAGTYGEVWKGVHVDDPDFTVAVKLVSPQVREDPAFLTALRKECRALDRMDHPSIVRFRELVVRDSTVAMVLELLEGADLEAVLASGPQPVEEVVRLLDRVLDGLAWELLAGRRACTGTDLAQKMGWHMTTGLPDVRTERADCPVWLAEVVAALGAKEASGRPVDGAAALALLRSRRIAGASVIGARPEPACPGSRPRAQRSQGRARRPGWGAA